jgi:uncharacterized protein (DUF169 family)
MDLKDVVELAKSIRNTLHLKTMPVGIKFFTDVKEIPSSFEIIQKKKVLCNVIGMSRLTETPVAITRENTRGLCVVADLSTGFGTVPPEFAQKSVGSFAVSVEETTKILQGMKSMGDGKYAAVGISPMDIMPVMPDVIQIWGNPTQMLELVYSNTWNNAGTKVVLETNGHGASCYEALSLPIVENRIRMCIADMGDKRHGYAGDDEMIMGVPPNLLKKLHEGLVATMKTLNKLPVIYNFDDINFPIPRYALEHSPIFKK